MPRKKKERFPVKVTVELTVMVSDDASPINAVGEVLRWAKLYDKQFKYQLLRTKTGEIIKNY